MEILLSHLAEIAAQERALLEECGDLLSVAASLEVSHQLLLTSLYCPLDGNVYRHELCSTVHC